MWLFLESLHNLVSTDSKKFLLGFLALLGHWNRQKMMKVKEHYYKNVLEAAGILCRHKADIVVMRLQFLKNFKSTSQTWDHISVHQDFSVCSSPVLLKTTGPLSGEAGTNSFCSMEQDEKVEKELMLEIISFHPTLSLEQTQSNWVTGLY